MNNLMFIDNGVTGSIGVFGDYAQDFLLTPVFKVQDYTKAKKNISRVDVAQLARLLDTYKPSMVVLERPLINPTRFSASISAARALEATITTLELQGYPYMFCDSKEWQREVLPKGIKGSAELKKASMDIGLRLFPQFSDLIKKHKDADGILGACVFARKFRSAGGQID